MDTHYTHLRCVINPYLTSGKAADTLEDFQAAADELSMEWSTVLTEYVMDDSHHMVHTALYLMLDNNPYVVAALEGRGARFINAHNAVLTADSKALTYGVVRDMTDVLTPRTWVVPYYHIDDDRAWIDEYARSFSGRVPVVVKVDDSSMGRGVFLAETARDVAEVLRDNSSSRLVVQDYVGSSFGRDIRVLIAHGKVLAVVRRSSNGNDFRSNIAVGGNMTVTSIDSRDLDIALDVMERVGLTYGSVDFLIGESGLIVNEVNARPRLHTINALVGRNTAIDILAPYVA